MSHALLSFVFHSNVLATHNAHADITILDSSKAVKPWAPSNDYYRYDHSVLRHVRGRLYQSPKLDAFHSKPSRTTDKRLRHSEITHRRRTVSLELLLHSFARRRGYSMLLVVKDVVRPL
ncbi:hypothetical protein F5Y07DRAFT_364038 [Xylaria sp. FL0933]|nr:hypothetical protein F5Y07DRAFT_364038 [Xylaria sp. FL0933]